LETATKNFKQIVKLKSAVNNEEAEEFIILAYMEKTGIYQKLRDLLYDIYYGKKFPNPLPKICIKIEEYNRVYSDVVLSKNVIEDEIYRPDTKVEEALNAGKKIQNYYWASRSSLNSQPRRRRPGLEADVWSICHHQVTSSPKSRHYPGKPL
jgi:hypothetical protein